MATIPLSDPLEVPPDIGSEPLPPYEGKPPRRAAVIFIFITALIDIIAIGVIVPVLPRLVEDFTGDPGKAAQYVGLFGATFALMQFFASPIQGALSDRFGRRPVLLISIFGLGLDYVLMALAPNLWWLFLGRIIAGITAASFSTANAYIADVTPPEGRAKAYGLMGAAFGIGFIAGPLIGGVLGSFDPRWPFWGAAALALLNGCYGLFVLPESLPKERRSPFRVRNANPLGSLQLYARSRDLTLLAGVIFLFYLAHQVLQSTFVLYTSTRYGWTTTLVGVSLAITGIGSIIVQGGVVGPVVKRFKERGALYIGLFCGMLGMIWYGTAWTGWLYWFGAPVFALMGLVGPGINGLMTRRVGPHEQGRLQGANAGLMALAGMIGPIFFTQLYAWSIRDGRDAPGLAVYVAAAVLAGALFLAWRTPKADAADLAEPTRSVN
jgi:DHA1 family tetracycline resistance protein-like MFS transporter